MAKFQKQLDVLDAVDEAIDGSLEAGGEYFDKELIQQRFIEGNKGKFGWAPHSPAYARTRKPGPMLVQTGNMKNSIVGKGTVSTNGGNIKISYNPSVEYAQYHITGTAKMPARDWTKKISSDNEAMDSEIQSYLNKELSGEDT